MAVFLAALSSNWPEERSPSVTALVKCKYIVFQIKFAEVCTIKIVIIARYKISVKLQV